MTNNMTDQELDIMIKTLIDSGKTSKQEILKEIELIDDLLGLQKSRMLFMPARTKSGRLRKDARLQDIIEKRIELNL